MISDDSDVIARAKGVNELSPAICREFSLTEIFVVQLLAFLLTPWPCWTTTYSTAPRVSFLPLFPAWGPGLPCINDVQVGQLITFFGALFGLDHQSGITASTTALRCRTHMKRFRPRMASTVLELVAQLGADFRLQAISPRLQVYELIRRLLEDEHVRVDLQRGYGDSCDFMEALVRLCHYERDPKSLMAWFGIVRLFLSTYSMSPEAAGKMFQSYSDYYPISMRSHTSSSEVTVDDLKSALRACFSANYRIAETTFNFLIEKLDGGDAVTMTVKVWNLLEAQSSASMPD